MARFVVMEPGEEPSERAVFVRDHFSLWAFLFPFLWLFRYGLLLSGLVVLGLTVALNYLGGLTEFWLANLLLPLALGVIVALEGPGLRLARLRRRGWRDAEVVDADDSAEAEIRYYMESGANAEPVPVAPPTVLAGYQRPPRTLLDVPIRG